jgi:hypothetical protein
MNATARVVPRMKAAPIKLRKLHETQENKKNDLFTRRFEPSGCYDDALIAAVSRCCRFPTVALSAGLFVSAEH